MVSIPTFASFLVMSIALSSGNGNIPSLGSLSAQNAWIQNQLQFQADSLAFIAPSYRSKRQTSHIVANLPVPGSPTVAWMTPKQQAEWYQAQLEVAQQQIGAGRRKRTLPLPGTAGRRKRSLPLPGTPSVLSLESNPQAKAEWYWAQQAHLAQLAAQEALVTSMGRKKRSLPLPGTPSVLSLESNPQAKAEWYWAQQAHQAQLAAHKALVTNMGRERRSTIPASLPVPGSPLVASLTPEQAAYWYQAQLAQAQLEMGK